MSFLRTTYWVHTETSSRRLILNTDWAKVPEPCYSVQRGTRLTGLLYLRAPHQPGQDFLRPHCNLRSSLPVPLNQPSPLSSPALHLLLALSLTCSADTQSIPQSPLDPTSSGKLTLLTSGPSVCCQAAWASWHSTGHRTCCPFYCLPLHSTIRSVCVDKVCVCLVYGGT